LNPNRPMSTMEYQEIREAIVRLDEKVNALLHQRDERRTQDRDVDKRISRLADRVRSLETWKAWLLGGLAIIAFGLGLVARHIQF
jgi:chromosome segregation ATPase